MTNWTTVRLEPVEIQHVKIRRRLLGYDRGDVDRLLEDVTAQYEEVWLERDRLQAEAAALRTELAESRERERLVGDALVRAQRIAETTVAEAKQTAESLVRAARTQADEILRQAQREPQRLQEEVQRLQTVERDIHARLRDFLAAAERWLEEPTNGRAASASSAEPAEHAPNGAQGAPAPPR